MKLTDFPKASYGALRRTKTYGELHKAGLPFKDANLHNIITEYTRGAGITIPKEK